MFATPDDLRKKSFSLQPAQLGGITRCKPGTLIMPQVCEIYKLWLTEMLRNDGPGPMDAVAWLHVRRHRELCPFCSKDRQVVSGVRAMLNKNKQRQGARGSVKAALPAQRSIVRHV
jgi:hypothetical protein